jgi:hypothetical protein
MEHHEPKTLSVPDAGKRYFNLGKNAAYAAAKSGQIPIIKIGAKLRVPVIALERMLAEAGRNEPNDTLGPKVL